MAFPQQHGAQCPMGGAETHGLFVKSLSKCTTERHLLALFSPFGLVRDIQASLGPGSAVRGGRGTAG